MNTQLFTIDRAPRSQSAFFTVAGRGAGRGQPEGSDFGLAPLAELDLRNGTVQVIWCSLDAGSASELREGRPGVLGAAPELVLLELKGSNKKPEDGQLGFVRKCLAIFFPTP